MAIRSDFTAGEILSAVDLNDTFAAKLNLAGGKILQIVRATDATQRTTTSTSYVDANISVTITPQKSTSAILILATGTTGQNNATNNVMLGLIRITDSSNNAISGAQNVFFGADGLTRATTAVVSDGYTIIAYATPATTSPVTYKLQFRVTNAANLFALENSQTTGQMYAIEVSA
jgi:hypothetical protein